MSPSESATMDAMLIARGYKIIGPVSPAIDGATDDEVSMIFAGDVKGALRDMYRSIAASQPAVQPESAAS